MNYSKGKKYARVGGSRRLYALLTKCYQKGKVLLLICAKVSGRKRSWLTINLTTIIKSTRAQFTKEVIDLMVVVRMSLMPPKAIGRKTCLCTISHFGPSKDPGLERRLNI
jgi:hypothetical protein